MPAPKSRILVVDDDVDICTNLIDILSDLGFHVESAHNAEAALDLVRSATYEIALLDYKMPGMSGAALYREIKSLCPHVVALMVTAHAAAVAEEALALGAWQVLPKPLELPRLLRLVQEALSQPLVLVVDDDRDLCSNLWDLLREHGCRVGIAHDRDEARERLGQADFDVVIIDLKLPAGDGREVLECVRAALPEARTVLITGSQGEPGVVVEQIVKEGFDALCFKPLDVPKLVSTIEMLLKSTCNRA